MWARSAGAPVALRFSSGIYPWVRPRPAVLGVWLFGTRTVEPTPSRSRYDH